ncbi:MAG: uroporphyrinogen-III C-methyltransferase [Planktomarina sp.]
MTGFVSFVGAGPGDPDLLTLKAVDRLSRADVVLFDDLASGPMLIHAPAEAELIAVGKRAGRASPKQEDICDLMTSHASKGRRVVRLKSGDSGVFGRLEEELIAVRGASIPHEIIPGIPSAVAAAAEAGIPLTRRETSRRVQFVTGHGPNGELPDDLNITALADPSATTAIFMGKRTFPKLYNALIKSGLPKDQPAIMAQAIGTKDQEIIRTSACDLADKLDGSKSPHPALILLGPFPSF